METLTAYIEVEEELDQADKWGIEDAITDALEKLGISVKEVRVRFS